MSLVRSTLEYASCLWSPYSVKHRGFPENTLRRATKFILNYPLRELAYKDKLEQLDLRRDIHDVVLLFKFKFGDVTENFDRFWFSQYLDSLLEILCCKFPSSVLS